MAASQRPRWHGFKRNKFDSVDRPVHHDSRSDQLTTVNGIQQTPCDISTGATDTIAATDHYGSPPPLQEPSSSSRCNLRRPAAPQLRPLHRSHEDFDQASLHCNGKNRGHDRRREHATSPQTQAAACVGPATASRHFHWSWRVSPRCARRPRRRNEFEIESRMHPSS
jgi:hypothetical protein